MELFIARKTSRNQASGLLYFCHAAIIKNVWLPAKLIIARILSKVLTKSIIRMQAIETTSPMLQSFRVEHGVKYRV